MKTMTALGLSSLIVLTLAAFTGAARPTIPPAPSESSSFFAELTYASRVSRGTFWTAPFPFSHSGSPIRRSPCATAAVARRRGQLRRPIGSGAAVLLLAVSV